MLPDTASRTLQDYSAELDYIPQATRTGAVSFIRDVYEAGPSPWWLWLWLWLWLWVCASDASVAAGTRNLLTELEPGVSLDVCLDPYTPLPPTGVRAYLVAARLPMMHMRW